MAAATISRSTRGLCFIISVMGLLRLASTMGVNSKLVEIKMQIQQLEEFLKTQRAKLESERSRNFLILKETKAKVNILRRYSDVSGPELDSLERYTENANCRVRGSFTEMMETLEYHESRLEEWKEIVKNVELMGEMQLPMASM